MSAQLRPGQVAAAAGVNLETLRYYERRGLLERPERTLGGHRVYPSEAVTLLRIIKTAQRLGFSLTEVGELLDVATRRHGQRRSSELQIRAKAKLVEVEQKITELTTIRNTLLEAISGECVDLLDCANTPTCPIPISELFTAERIPGAHPGHRDQHRNDVTGTY
jgi:DNA-binding transcriptional MerR regulator